jgi:cobalt transporter subunit CbtB
MMSQSSQAALPLAKGRSLELLQALAAMALGLLIIGMVGFSHIEVAHNAAHDVRHSTAFPCH